MLAMVLVSLASLLAGAARAADPQGFMEDFSGPALGLDWQVVQTHAGGPPRAHGFTSAANRFSMTDNPGFLRYSLDPMTHFDGYVIDYATTVAEHSCCRHDAGLELHRPFTGNFWTLQAKATYFLPFTNGRSFDLRVYWGDGSPGSYFARLWRGRDVNQNFVALLLHQQTGTTPADYSPSLVGFQPGGNAAFPIFGGPDVTDMWWRLERAGGEISAYWSFDGVVWDLAWTHDLGSALAGLDQRVVVTGLSWFITGDSYADWDYVNVVPATLPIGIDIKPGSARNPVNTKSNGNVPVAILGSDSFDVADIDVETLMFGPAGALPKHDLTDPFVWLEHHADVNGDGWFDLVAHFSQSSTGLSSGDASACLDGATLEGRPLQGCDAVDVK